MKITQIGFGILPIAEGARTIYQQQVGPVLGSLLIGATGEKLAIFTIDGSTGWLVQGGFDLQQLWPDQVEETLGMGSNHRTQTISGVTLHTINWPSISDLVFVISAPEAGAFMLFPPGCFAGHADTHDAVLC